MKSILGKTISVTQKIIIPGILILMVICTTIHFIWKSSGSNEWKLVKDQDGIKVYSLKSPGATLLKFKTNMQVKASIATAVFALRGGLSTAADFSGTDFKVIEQIETPSLYMATYSVNQVMPPPLGTKEIVMLLNYSQDAESKKVVINVQAAPGRVPPNKNISRVKHLNNKFNITPLPNGEVDWEMVMDVDMGIPYVLFNMVLPDTFIKELSYMRELIKKDKYKNAKLMSVVEL